MKKNAENTREGVAWPSGPHYSFDTDVGSRPRQDWTPHKDQRINIDDEQDASTDKHSITRGCPRLSAAAYAKSARAVWAGSRVFDQTPPYAE